MNQLKILVFSFCLFVSGGMIAQSSAIGVSIDDQKVTAGEQVCLPVTVYGFQNMLSMQYSISFDPEQLEFQGIVNRQLPYLNDSNFGVHDSDKGIITVVWIDNSLQGVKKEDGAPVFTLCFRTKGKAGTKTEVKFTNDPTPFESVNKAEQLVKINTKKGTVTFQ